MIAARILLAAVWPNGDPREVAHRILLDRRYHLGPQGPAPKTWLEQLLDALDAFWRRVTEPLGQLAGNDLLSRIVGFIILAALLVALVYAAVRFGRNVRFAGARRDAVRADALFDGADARTLLARALAAAAEGRHHDAAALLWASALRALDEHGRVRYDAARTPGEWRRAVRDPSFDALARDAVVALFGDRGADAALVARMRAAYDRVVAPA
ncbi:MAG: DUF4129 domain-containing protein [Candidatus Eremiobacteraeota bacterium]|nr:DUF4129 domain-containing protein [Candidatus Eremiobacteraeota bacterium]